MSAGITLMPSTIIAICPPLNHLLIRGPNPLTYTLSDEFMSFIRAHVAAGKGIFTTCTGGFIVASAGILDGKRATTNHMAIPFANIKFPKMLWTDQKEWVVEDNGQLWTSVGVCAVMDMMAHWVLRSTARKLVVMLWRVWTLSPGMSMGNVYFRSSMALLQLSGLRVRFIQC